MKKILLLLLLVLFAGCKPTHYVQVYETKGLQTKVENNFHVFENDSVKITYIFWNDKGSMAFNILNKLNIPLYINWNKSFFQTPTGKLAYLQDIQYLKNDGKQFLNSVHTVYTGSRYKEGLENIQKKQLEQITTILPNKEYSNLKFLILPIDKLPLRPDAKTELVKLNFYSDKEVAVKTEDFIFE